MGFFVAQIPDEAIQASFRLDFFFWFLVVRIWRLVEALSFGTRIFADELARCIEDFELGFCLRFRSVFQIESRSSRL